MGALPACPKDKVLASVVQIISGWLSPVTVSPQMVPAILILNFIKTQLAKLVGRLPVGLFRPVLMMEEQLVISASRLSSLVVVHLQP